MHMRFGSAHSFVHRERTKATPCGVSCPGVACLWGAAAASERKERESDEITPSHALTTYFPPSGARTYEIEPPPHILIHAAAPASPPAVRGCETISSSPACSERSAVCLAFLPRRGYAVREQCMELTGTCAGAPCPCCLHYLLCGHDDVIALRLHFSWNKIDGHPWMCCRQLHDSHWGRHSA